MKVCGARGTREEVYSSNSTAIPVVYAEVIQELLPELFTLAATAAGDMETFEDKLRLFIQ